jgi:hypothetical protein
LWILRIHYEKMMFCLKQTYQGFAPTHASRHCMSETAASEAKRLPYCRFASLRGTKQSRVKAVKMRTRFLSGIDSLEETNRSHIALTLDCFVVPPRNDAKRQSGARQSGCEALKSKISFAEITDSTLVNAEHFDGVNGRPDSTPML